MKSEATNHLQVKFIKVNVIIYKYFRNCMLCENFLQTSQCPLGPRFVSMYQHPEGACLTITALPVMSSVAI